PASIIPTRDFGTERVLALLLFDAFQQGGERSGIGLRLQIVLNVIHAQIVDGPSAHCHKRYRDGVENPSHNPVLAAEKILHSVPHTTCSARRIRSTRIRQPACPYVHHTVSEWIFGKLTLFHKMRSSIRTLS